jgi:hypothetical protein
MVIMPDGTHRRKTEQIIYRHMIGIRVPVDVIVATVDDIEKYCDSAALIYRDALKEGKELYAA